MKAIITIILTLQVTIVFSCHCRYQCPYWPWEDTKNIVVAKVISVDTVWEQVDENHWLYHDYDSIPLQEYIILVKRTIKGNLKTITHKIVADIDEGACGQIFKIGKTYIIYLHDYPKFNFYTSDCDRNTRKISKEKKALNNRKNNEEQCGIWRKRRPPSEE